MIRRENILSRLGFFLLLDRLRRTYGNFGFSDPQGFFFFDPVCNRARLRSKDVGVHEGGHDRDAVGKPSTTRLHNGSALDTEHHVRPEKRCSRVLDVIKIKIHFSSCKIEDSPKLIVAISV